VELRKHRSIRFVSPVSAAVSVAACVLAACAEPSKSDRAGFEKPRQPTTSSTDAGTRQNPAAPVDGASRPTTPGTGQRPPGAASGGQDGTYDATTAGACADPAKAPPTVMCGPYSPERRVLCLVFGGGSSCLEAAPRDGWTRTFSDKMRSHLASHAPRGPEEATLYATSGPCNDTRVIEGLPLRLLDSPSEDARVVAELADSSDKVNVEKTLGYWSQAKVGLPGAEKIGWVVSKGLRCNASPPRP
jgi:hypothetical protein